MLEVLEFIFRDMPTFLGTIVLIYVIGESISEIIESINTRRNKKDE